MKAFESVRMKFVQLRNSLVSLISFRFNIDSFMYRGLDIAHRKSYLFEGCLLYGILLLFGRNYAQTFLKNIYNFIKIV